MSDVEVGRADGVQTLVLNRAAKKNALTQAMYGALCDAIEDGDADADVHAHVLIGTDGVFTAGNDISDFLAHSKSSGATDGNDNANVLRFVRLLPRIKKPLLAAVDGPAVGIGTTLLFHCDLVYATERAQFATPFLDLGLVPEAGASLLMPQRMGHARAFEMLALAAPFSAERMREAGIVNALVEPGALKQQACAAARTLGNKPPEALKLTRALMRGDRDELLKRIESEIVTFGKRLKSPEAIEAFQAFLEKRPPDFANQASG